MNKDQNMKNLTQWQRRGLIILGGVIGGVAVHGLLRWLTRREKEQAKTDGAPPQPGM